MTDRLAAPAPTLTPSIEFEAVSFAYPDGTRALDGVSLRIEPGELVAIVGQNGSGKSTLVRHLNGLLRPTTGRVLFDGRDVRSVHVAELARKVGLAFQNPDRQLFAGRVSAEVAFGPRNLGVRGAELEERVQAVLEAVGLGAEAAAHPYDLGHSRRKLLALASVLAMGTPVLALDEPTTSQDARGVARVRAVVARAALEGRTIIAISHDMRFVAESFRRVVVMRAGRVVLDGAPEAVFGEPAWPELRASYLEPPLPAVAGARLGLGSTPTEAALVAAVVAAERTAVVAGAAAPAPAPHTDGRRGANVGPEAGSTVGGDKRQRMRVLVLNPGSSSLKTSVIESSTVPVVGADGIVPPVPAAALAPLGRLGVDWGVDATAEGDPADDLRALLARYEEAGIPVASLGAVGYRVVHGGSTFREPTLLTPEVVADVAGLRSLAPLHNGVAVETMTAGLAAIPQLPQVAVFDTAFHATLPEEAYRYPVPAEWYRDWGVRRYGFHGISVAWSTERAAALLARPVGELRLVVAHLGSGCSVTAVDGGRSVATSMGLTPLEGLMMGTRAGSIDPGIIFYILRTGRLDADGLADQLDHHSGLLGVSGRTSDVRELLALEASGDQAATLALTLFVRRAAESIAAAATSLPRLDAIVFTGGIGENAAGLRARIVGRLASLGVALISDESVAEDAILGRPSPAAGSTHGSADSPAVLRIEAREDLIIAREAARAAGTTHEIEDSSGL